MNPLDTHSKKCYDFLKYDISFHQELAEGLAQ
ncbi:hypothetical protein P22_2421 [Propionispora sp. 2/2-37]|nr:hypothetical protein P22_2421 [Propionispora sp. 2/2-37]